MKIERNVMINKAGGTAGKESVNYRISLPKEAIKELGITNEDRKVTLEVKDKTVIIKKA